MPPSTQLPVLLQISGSRAETSKLMCTGESVFSMKLSTLVTLSNLRIFFCLIISYSASSMIPRTPTKLIFSKLNVGKLIRDAQCSISSPVQTARTEPWVFPVVVDLNVCKSGYAPIQITSRSLYFCKEANTEEDTIDRSPPRRIGLFSFSRV